MITIIIIILFMMVMVMILMMMIIRGYYVSEFQLGVRVSGFYNGPLPKHPIIAHSRDEWTRM